MNGNLHQNVMEKKHWLRQGNCFQSFMEQLISLSEVLVEIGFLVLSYYDRVSMGGNAVTYVHPFPFFFWIK